ncbi:hypothetical protein GQ55_9G126200 [Panicum hallii var. hallii]|uniref:Uncharacterized protein n=1 Tax=Panicum hallii var. hallii TaxID=1504633 RepID=A0A2T7C2F3_9POAL|nr:hypothetical protein GQ55_9G126200 [Panicum hallii var. hallii]
MRTSSLRRLEAGIDRQLRGFEGAAPPNKVLSDFGQTNKVHDHCLTRKDLVNLSDGGTFQLKRADRPEAGSELHIGRHDEAGGPGVPMHEPPGEAAALNTAIITLGDQLFASCSINPSGPRRYSTTEARETRL